MSYTTPEALKQRGLEILKILCIDKDFDRMTDALNPNVEAYHDDNPPHIGKEVFLSHWKMLLTKLPGMSYNIYDAVAELDKGGEGGRVWIFSRLSGLPGGIAKDTVDMFEIDGYGKLVRCKDVQRAVEQ